MTDEEHNVQASTDETASQEITPIIQNKKLKNLDAEYDLICKYIDNFDGLFIDCELEMQKEFPQINRLTLKSILQTELTNRMRGQFWRYEAKAKKYLKSFEEQSALNPLDHTILIDLSLLEGLSPVVMCRAILQEKYQFENKSELSRLMKYPHLIDNSELSANVIQCLCSDSQDGPLVDLRRRVVGEEYEVKLKELAQKAGMHFYDENDLRRLGFDKTPDIKMILPFLYKGEIVNWIESKATFGDAKTHKWYVQQQLNSYSNRFGSGIIIYWFGYHNATPLLAENRVGIIVLDDFPEAEHMQFLDLNTDLEIPENFTINSETVSPIENEDKSSS